MTLCSFQCGWLIFVAAFYLFSSHYGVNCDDSPCVKYLRAGSACISKSVDCPEGTTEYTPYSNYLGCQALDQKCCQANPPDQLLAHDRSQCGMGSLQLSTRILDGYVTGMCDWPFVVSIRGKLLTATELNYEGSQHACQGVLIDPLWVLTSPYCVFSAGNSTAEAPDNMLVVAGEYNISGIDINPETGAQQEQVIRVESAHLYPNYPYNSKYDLVPVLGDTAAINSDGVALIKLAEPISGPCSGVACLPTQEEAANGCAAYDRCIITGWGFSTAQLNEVNQILLLSEVRMSSYTACEFLTERLSLQSVRPRGSICQAPRNRNTDSCLGDEGGPVLCATGSNWVVRGILPLNHCQDDRFNIFVTDAAPYLGWIQATIESTATLG